MMNAWDWPQWVMIVWLVLFTIVGAKPPHHSPGMAIATTATWPLMAWVLWMGGFWS